MKAKAEAVEAVSEVIHDVVRFDLNGLYANLTNDGILSLDMPIIGITCPIMTEEAREALLKAGFTTIEIEDELEKLFERFETMFLARMLSKRRIYSSI